MTSKDWLKLALSHLENAKRTLETAKNAQDSNAWTKITLAIRELDDVKSDIKSSMRVKNP